MTDALALPDCYVITPEPASDSAADIAAFLRALDATLAAGYTLVQLRVKSLDAAGYAQLAAASIAICRTHRARVIVNGPIAPAAALALGAHGMHLGSAALADAAKAIAAANAADVAAAAARPVPAGVLLSAACHSPGELHDAARVGADLVTLSPVLPTASHPGTPPLGWARFAEYAARARMPVYALGGMSPAQLDDARRHGARGVAGIRGFWSAPDRGAAPADQM